MHPTGRSYVIRVGDKEFRRNRRFLKPVVLPACKQDTVGEGSSKVLHSDPSVDPVQDTKDAVTDDNVPVHPRRSPRNKVKFASSV